MFLSIKYADIPRTNRADVIYEPETVCKNLLIPTGDRATSAKLVISFLKVSSLNVVPTGNCIQPLATSIQNALRLDPMATIHVENR